MSLTELRDTRKTIDALHQKREELKQKRDALIFEMRKQGYPWANIAEAAGLSVNMCERIVFKLNGGVALKVKWPPELRKK